MRFAAVVGFAVAEQAVRCPTPPTGKEDDCIDSETDDMNVELLQMKNFNTRSKETLYDLEKKRDALIEEMQNIDAELLEKKRDALIEEMQNIDAELLLLEASSMKTAVAASASAKSSRMAVSGFWYGYAESAVTDPPPTGVIYTTFPGLVVTPPFTSGSGSIPADPSGDFTMKVLCQGGGGDVWDDTVYTTMTSQLADVKSAGWAGFMIDWEQVGAGHTTDGFNAFMAAVKAAGLTNFVTSTAEGPYTWSADTDASGIDWANVDYFVPQMYGPSGANYPDTELTQYKDYWLNGAGVNIHSTTFSAIPVEKIMWGLQVGTCDVASDWGGAGCFEWAYSPNR
jgi:hypothetical protein